MRLAPPARKLSLVLHVTASVGWLGAVAAVLALAVVGVASSDPERVRAAYVATDVAARYALLPFSLASLVTGVVHALGTAWGLFRHYWVVTKLAINLLATTILLLYLQTLTSLAESAQSPQGRANVETVKTFSPVVHAAGGLTLLLVATVLAIYKPRGLTRYGRRHTLQARLGDDRAPR